MGSKKKPGVFSEEFVCHKIIYGRAGCEYAERNGYMNVDLRYKKYKGDDDKADGPKAAQPVEYNGPKYFFCRELISFVEQINFIAIAAGAAGQQEIIEQPEQV